MSEVQHSAAVQRPCFGCMMTGEVIISAEMAHEWSISETKMVR